MNKEQYQPQSQPIRSSAGLKNIKSNCFPLKTRGTFTPAPRSLSLHPLAYKTPHAAASTVLTACSLQQERFTTRPRGPTSPQPTAQVTNGLQNSGSCVHPRQVRSAVTQKSHFLAVQNSWCHFSVWYKRNTQPAVRNSSLNPTHGAESSLRMWQLLSWSRNSPSLMESKI
jgi:hypothetical protein